MILYADHGPKLKRGKVAKGDRPVFSTPALLPRQIALLFGTQQSTLAYEATINCPHGFISAK
jgi:hypothetical protein